MIGRLTLATAALLVALTPSAWADADIVWQNRNGQVHYWPMRDGQRMDGFDVYIPVGPDWRLAGVGDVDQVAPRPVRRW